MEDVFEDQESVRTQNQGSIDMRAKRQFFILRAFSTKIGKDYLLNLPKSSNLGFLGVSYLNWTDFHQPLNTLNFEQL
jgi:hypothetical protein